MRRAKVRVAWLQTYACETELWVDLEEYRADPDTLYEALKERTEQVDQSGVKMALYAREITGSAVLETRDVEIPRAPDYVPEWDGLTGETRLIMDERSDLGMGAGGGRVGADRAGAAAAAGGPVSEHELGGVSYQVPVSDYQVPPGVIVHFDPGDDEDGLDVEVTVRSRVKSKQEMLYLARKGLVAALGGDAGGASEEDQEG